MRPPVSTRARMRPRRDSIQAGSPGASCRDPASADSMLRGALSDENLPAPRPELDPEIAATIHRANVTALVEPPRPADQEDHRQEPPPDHEPTRQTESGVAG